MTDKRKYKRKPDRFRNDLSLVFPVFNDSTKTKVGVSQPLRFSEIERLAANDNGLFMIFTDDIRCYYVDEKVFFNILALLEAESIYDF